MTKWFKCATIRALKTLAQTFIGMVGSAIMLQDVNWYMVGSACILATLLSYATSVYGLPEVSEDE